MHRWSHEIRVDIQVLSDERVDVLSGPLLALFVVFFLKVLKSLHLSAFRRQLQLHCFIVDLLEQSLLLSREELERRIWLRTRSLLVGHESAIQFREGVAEMELGELHGFLSFGCGTRLGLLRLCSLLLFNCVQFAHQLLVLGMIVVVEDRLAFDVALGDDADGVLAGSFNMPFRCFHLLLTALLPAFLLHQTRILLLERFSFFFSEAFDVRFQFHFSPPDHILRSISFVDLRLARLLPLFDLRELFGHVCVARSLPVSIRESRG